MHNFYLINPYHLTGALQWRPHVWNTGLRKCLVCEKYFRDPLKEICFSSHYFHFYVNHNFIQTDSGCWCRSTAVRLQICFHLKVFLILTGATQFSYWAPETLGSLKRLNGTAEQISFKFFFLYVQRRGKKEAPQKGKWE